MGNIWYIICYVYIQCILYIIYIIVYYIPTESDLGVSENDGFIPKWPCEHGHFQTHGSTNTIQKLIFQWTCKMILPRGEIVFRQRTYVRFDMFRCNKGLPKGPRNCSACHTMTWLTPWHDTFPEDLGCGIRLFKHTRATKSLPWQSSPLHRSRGSFCPCATWDSKNQLCQLPANVAIWKHLETIKRICKKSDLEPLSRLEPM